MKYWLSDQILFHEKNYFIWQKVEKLHIRVKTLRKRPTTKSQKKGIPHKKSWIFAFQYMMQECQCCLRFELHHKCHPSRKNMNEWTFWKTALTSLLHTFLHYWRQEVWQATKWQIDSFLDTLILSIMTLCMFNCRTSIS